MENRIALARSLSSQVTFPGNILMLGCGAVARASLPLLFQLIAFDPQKLTIIDFVDVSSRIATYLEKGAQFVTMHITPENYRTILSSYLKPGDLLLDLSWNIDTNELLQFCHDNGILYINTSVEVWDPYKSVQRQEETTLYHRHQLMRAMIRSWPETDLNPTAILDHGANPGFISHLVKKGLSDILHEKVIPSPMVSNAEKDRLLLYHENNYFNLLAQTMGLNVVHISERDTQITGRPKRPNEFVNTWSVEGFIEEGVAQAELGWGTHEKTLPHNALTHATGNKSQIALNTRGLATLMRSWIKSGPIIGMLIRHGEAYSISDRLAVYPAEEPISYIHSALRHTDRTNSALYRPTVHYVYCPCDGALASIHELRMKEYEPQKDQRIMYSDILSGRDELGCLLMGSFGLWWTGSLLDIDETRQIINSTENEINATTLQVASSVVASVIYAMRHPNVGICTADDIDHREILKLASPFWGPIWSGEIVLSDEEVKRIKGYQFQDFHVNESS